MFKDVPDLNVNDSIFYHSLSHSIIFYLLQDDLFSISMAASRPCFLPRLRGQEFESAEEVDPDLGVESWGSWVPKALNFGGRNMARMFGELDPPDANHGAGIFTYNPTISGWCCSGKCWEIVQHHGAYGYGNIIGIYGSIMGISHNNDITSWGFHKCDLHGNIIWDIWIRHLNF